MSKRFRHPKVKPGELKVYWGKDEGGNWDVIVRHGGSYEKRSVKPDCCLTLYHLCSQKPDLNAKPLFSVMQPSFIEELKNRGYDITTLKFSIQEKNEAQTHHSKPN